MCKARNNTNLIKLIPAQFMVLIELFLMFDEYNRGGSNPVQK